MRCLLLVIDLLFVIAAWYIVRDFVLPSSPVWFSGLPQIREPASSSVKASTVNKVRAPSNVAVVSIITEADEAYINSVRVLFRSVQSNLAMKAHLHVLVVDDVKLDAQRTQAFVDIGVSVRRVPKLTPPHPSQVQRFLKEFVKLRLFSMVEYERVLYLDADTLVVGRLDDVFALNFIDGAFLAAARDMRGGQWVRQVNCGTMLIKPNEAEFKRMYEALMKDKVQYEIIMSEQGFLNSFYAVGTKAESIVELPFEFNGNTAVEVSDPTFWKDHLPSLRIVHFTMKKPWQCGSPEQKHCSFVARWLKLMWTDIRCNYGAEQSSTPYRKPGSKHAVFTILHKPIHCKADILARNPEHYGAGLAMLGHSLKQMLPAPVQRFVMLQEGDENLDSACSELLRAAGWRTCTAPRIDTPHREEAFGRFKANFQKLALFNMLEFEKVLYVDVDLLPLQGFPTIFHDAVTPLNASWPLAGARDWSEGKWSNGFNGGVLVLRPSYKLFAHIMETISRDTVKYRVDMAEQGFLSSYFHEHWVEIPSEYNANLAIFGQDRQRWDAMWPRMKAIHYTMEKPWSCGVFHNTAAYQEICDFWLAAFYKENRALVTTAYWKIPSKQGSTKKSHQHYAQRLHMVMGLNASLSIYGDKQGLEALTSARDAQLPKMVSTTEVELEDLEPCASFRGILTSGRGSFTHPVHVPSRELGCVWLSKLHLLVQSATKHPEYAWHVWLDAGMHTVCEFKPDRQNEWPSLLSLIRLPPDKMIVSQSEHACDKCPVSRTEWPYCHCIAGTAFAVHRSMLPKLVPLFRSALQACLKAVGEGPDGWHCMNDQVIMSKLIWEQPELFDNHRMGYGAVACDLE
eukprot:CAMPEP_0172699506 /NCGR_PEP_ID=MMETSP1074-20121228/30225_1 /TAXON_ID=2916 /ORGANISM="Ceratium fusus, Strain PA161109" /LENGTH=850 /DNA_ID=CAMNT_0013520721 /DNA_START=72 /DNA_END=2624 /DNA_ORIENTATION=-